MEEVGNIIFGDNAVPTFFFHGAVPLPRAARRAPRTAPSYSTFPYQRGGRCI